MDGENDREKSQVVTSKTGQDVRKVDNMEDAVDFSTLFKFPSTNTSIDNSH